VRLLYGRGSSGWKLRAVCNAKLGTEAIVRMRMTYGLGEAGAARAHVRALLAARARVPPPRALWLGVLLTTATANRPTNIIIIFHNNFYIT
jgi:hypothetical protein